MLSVDDSRKAAAERRYAIPRAHRATLLDPDGPFYVSGIAGMNRPMFLHELAADWLPAMPDVHNHLSTHATPRILDLGCGAGASTRALAHAYPRATVVGVDLDADEFTPEGDLIERFNYGWSVAHCLPATMAENPVEANGTVLRPSTVRRWAAEAGFSTTTSWTSTTRSGASTADALTVSRSRSSAIVN